MSNPRAKAERSKAKDIRQGIEEQRPVGGKSRKGAKPYKLVGSMWLWENAIFGRYKTLIQAEQALASYQKKRHYSNLRIETDNEDIE